jgi:Ethanolamine utilization protein EutJ (predicted chaperonin)
MHDQNTQALLDVEKRVTALEIANVDLKRALDDNTSVTAAVKADTAILVDFAGAMQGFARFCRGVGRVIKFVGVYVAPIGLMVLTAWAVLKGKQP